MAATLVALLFWLTGCGIPTIAFIEGPKEDEIDLGGVVGSVVFRHNEDENSNVEDFRGYDIYYKIYDDGVAPASDGRKQWEVDRDTILLEPVPTGVQRLLNQQYRRMIVNDHERNIPTIEISADDRADDFEITINVSDVTLNSPESGTAFWQSTSSMLHRDTDDSTRERSYKIFRWEDEDSFVPGDEDISISAISADTVLCTALYAVAFGIEGATFRIIYSQPVLLRYLPLHGTTVCL